MENKELTPGQKLRNLRKDTGKTLQQVALAVGLTASAISNYENNIRKPETDKTWVKLANFYNVSVDYLMGNDNQELPTTIAYDTGSASESPETLHTYSADKQTQNVHPYILSKREKKHIDLYRQLNIEGKSQVDSYTSFIAQTQQYIDSAINPIIASIKYFDIPVSAGTGQFVDSDNYIMLDVFETPPAEAEFVVRVCGNSMEPTYSDGDKLYIKPQESVEIGEIGIFSINGDVFVKERGEDGLISHNDAYDKIVFNEGDTITCFGKVVGKCENYR